MHKKKLVILLSIVIVCIIIAPNAANRIRYGIEKLTGNINAHIEIEGIGIVKVENDYPYADNIILEGDTISITKKQTEGAEEVYIHGLIVNSFERPKLELNGVKDIYSARMFNRSIVSVFHSPSYIYRGFAFNLDVGKLKARNTVTIRCNDREEKIVLYMD